MKNTTLILTGVLLFLLTGCSSKEKPQGINFDDTIELNRQVSSQVPVLNVCVGSMITPEEGYEYYKRLLDYIGQKLGLKINFIDKNTYAEVNALLKSGSIDLAFVCGGPYIDGHEQFGLELLAAPLVNGKTVYYSYIIVRKESGIRDLQGLRGKTFAFVDPLSNTGRLLPTYILQEEFRERPEDFFKECLYTYDHDKSIRAVAHGLVDAAAVDSLIWDYMDKNNDEHTKQTKIIYVSGPCGIPPVVVRPGLDARLKARLKDTFLNMHEDKTGRDILNRMFVDRFVEIDDSRYNDIRKIKLSLGK